LVIIIIIINRARSVEVEGSAAQGRRLRGTEGRSPRKFEVERMLLLISPDISDSSSPVHPQTQDQVSAYAAAKITVDRKTTKYTAILYSVILICALGL